jgi:hypothetical protein
MPGRRQWTAGHQKRFHRLEAPPPAATGTARAPVAAVTAWSPPCAGWRILADGRIRGRAAAAKDDRFHAGAGQPEARRGSEEGEWAAPKARSGPQAVTARVTVGRPRANNGQDSSVRRRRGITH